MRLWDDLRFVIGLFFLLVTLTLAISSPSASPLIDTGPLDGPPAANLNAFATATMGCFAIVMLVLTFAFPLREHH